MLERRTHVIAIWIVVALGTPLLSAVPLSAQDVVEIFGTGFTPDDLKKGIRLGTGTFVEADQDTIVVLMRSWAAGQDRCEDWVILRGGRYRVEPSTPGQCTRRGDGTEIARAMGGASMVAHLTLPVLMSSDPKADDFNSQPPPKELQSLHADLAELEKRARARENENIKKQKQLELERQAAERKLEANQREKQKQLELETAEREKLTARREKLKQIQLEREAAEHEAARREKLEQLGLLEGENDAASKPPASKMPGGLVRSSLETFERGSAWYVTGEVENVSGRSLACVWLRFKMSTSFQERQAGVPDLDLGVLEVEVRELGVGETQRYVQALATRVALGVEPAVECE